VAKILSKVLDSATVGGYPVERVDLFTNVLVPSGIRRKELSPDERFVYRRPHPTPESPVPLHVMPREIVAAGGVGLTATRARDGLFGFRAEPSRLRTCGTSGAAGNWGARQLRAIWPSRQCLHRSRRNHPNHPRHTTHRTLPNPQIHQLQSIRFQPQAPFGAPRIVSAWGGRCGGRGCRRCGGGWCRR
jgi:hypothetical protein